MARGRAIRRPTARRSSRRTPARGPALPPGPALAPSLLSADFARLAEQIAAVEQGGARLLHLDVMDGHFVPNLTIGPPVVQAIARVTDLPLDVHLMIEAPERYIERFTDAGADLVSVHQEAASHLHRTVQRIQECGAAAGVALNPATPLGAIEEILPDLDYVLLMSVDPGFGGQRFIPSVMEKIESLRRMIDERGARARIEVDGGVGPGNVAELLRRGTDIFVAGSAVFDGGDPRHRARELVAALDRARRGA